MGRKTTKTTQTNKPIYESEIRGAADNISNAYRASLPGITSLSNNMAGYANETLDGLRGSNNAVLNANSFINSQLTGDPQSNPYLDRMIAQTGDNTRRAIQTQLGTRGGIGGSAEADIISRNLAQQELAARYADYDQSMNRKFQAAGLSALPISTASQIGTQGVMLPGQAAALQGAGIGGLLGQYQNVNGKQVQSGGLLESILGGAFQLGSAALMGCDVRLKENIQRIGKTPGGVPLYRFDYIGGEKGVIGPMAHEVAILQPEALGPEIGGYMTVNVGALQ